jgi:iron complex transport system ATP-binding protein
MSVATRGLSVSYGSNVVIDDLDLSVPTNEWLGVLGPNGAGKSTLLKAIAGLVESKGSITVDGATHAELGRKPLARRVAFVAQDPVIPPGISVTEYVLLGRTPHLSYLGSEGKEDIEAARLAMEMLRLVSLSDRHLDDLSGGERQRAALARALAQTPSVLLLDEPTSALDVGHRQQALELIGSIRKERPMTIVAAMHDLTLAGQFADRLVLLADGVIEADGHAAEVLTVANIQHFFDANVEVIAVAGCVAVVPVRNPSL